MKVFLLCLALGGALALLSACRAENTPSPTVTPTTVEATFTVIPTYTALPPTVTASPGAVPSRTVPPEPPGCKRPPDDYEVVEVDGVKLNRRTLAMLEYARTLYQGELEIDGYAITQGSYTNEVSASFGTHQGGGAVDLSVMRRGTYTVLWDEIEPLVHALRTAGFAAWLRDLDELYDGSPIHIHAIAVGDRELSSAAKEQLYGEAGYFKGFNGLPVKKGKSPIPDPYGGPVVCNWMKELEK